MFEEAKTDVLLCRDYCDCKAIIRTCAKNFKIIVCTFYANFALLLILNLICLNVKITASAHPAH
ncbi:hypothetical protein ACTXT7_005876 [Hymenolepis weldensis]